jgi:hypothetical protein
MPGTDLGLNELRELIEECRRSGVRHLKLPNGLELALDTRVMPADRAPAASEAGEF